MGERKKKKKKKKKKKRRKKTLVNSVPASLDLPKLAAG